MASVRGLTPEAIKALIEDSKRDYKVVRESLTTMYRRYEGLDSDLDHLSRRMDSLPDELKDSLDSLVDLDEVLEAAREEVDSLRQRFPIKGVDIADDAITANKIEAGAITALQIAAGAVTTEKLAAGAVVAEKIDAEAVTAEKLAADSVTAGSIAADSILTRHIGTEQVTAEKLKAGSVEADKIAAGAVTADSIAAGAVTSDSIAAGAVTADSIEAGAIQIKPDSIFPTVGGANIPRDETRTYTNPALGVSKTLTGFHPKSTYTIPFTDADSVALHADGKYTLSGTTGISRIEPNRHHSIIIYILCDKVGGKDVLAEVTGTTNCESEVLGYWQDHVAPDASEIELSVRPLYGDHDALSWSVDFEVYHETANTIKIREIRLDVRREYGEHFISAIDILAPPVTARDISIANRRLELFSQSLSESINELTQRLTVANRELYDLHSKVSAPTSFMLTHPARPSKNGVSIETKTVGSEERYVLVNDSLTSVAYASTIAASHGTKSSDVVWSGVVQPFGYANIGPYVKNAPVSAFVDPDGDSETLGGSFDIELEESDYKNRGILPIYEFTVAGIYDPDELYRRVSVSVDAVVPQVGSSLISTKVRTYVDYVVVNVSPSWNSKETRNEHTLAQHEQRAGSFGTQRYNVAYTMSYDGDVPSERANAAGYYLLTVGVIASNSSGELVGTKLKGGYTFYK